MVPFLRGADQKEIFGQPHAFIGVSWGWTTLHVRVVHPQTSFLGSLFFVG
jgi:hypothetical protein